MTPGVANGAGPVKAVHWPRSAHLDAPRTRCHRMVALRCGTRSFALTIRRVVVSRWKSTYMRGSAFYLIAVVLY